MLQGNLICCDLTLFSSRQNGNLDTAFDLENIDLTNMDITRQIIQEQNSLVAKLR